MGFLTGFGLIAFTLAAEPPLLPFNNTGDLFVLDDESDAVLRITPGGIVSVHINRQQIQSVTGIPDVDLNSAGLAFDSDGAMYFSEDDSDTILKQETSGLLRRLVKTQDLEVALGFPPDINVTTLEFGSDGFLYGAEDETETVLRIDPSSGAVTILANAQSFQNELNFGETFDIDEGLVADDRGFLYLASGPSPPIIFKLSFS
jgi:uncharacterized protein YjiK